MAKCMLCGKQPSAANNVPKSLHKTRRMIRPNIQKVAGMPVCTRCLRTMRREARQVTAATTVPAA